MFRLIIIYYFEMEREELFSCDVLICDVFFFFFIDIVWNRESIEYYL